MHAMIMNALFGEIANTGTEKKGNHAYRTLYIGVINFIYPTTGKVEFYLSHTLLLTNRDGYLYVVD